MKKLHSRGKTVHGCVNIPNRELMGKFEDMLQKEPSLGYVYQLARASEKMLRATLTGDTVKMLEILEFAHNTEIPLLSYNDETELAAIVNLLELKVDHTAQEALAQIRDRKYALRFEGKLGELPKYKGRVLGVGIAYDRKAKAHSCKIEVLRESLK